MFTRLEHHLYSPLTVEIYGREGHYNRLVLRSISASFDNGVSPFVSKWTIKWEMKGHNIIIITNLCLEGN